MANPEKIRQIQEGLVRLGYGLNDEKVKPISRLLRASWVRPKEREREPKLLGQEAELLHLMASFIYPLSEKLDTNSELLERFFDEADSRTTEEKVLELAARCFIEVKKRKGLDENKGKKDF